MKENETSNFNYDEFFNKNESSVVSGKLSRGPKGLGDPNDRTLRKVEIEVMIPKIVRERAKELKCSEFKKEFDQCCLDNAMAMVFKCREENRLYQGCLNKWFFDKDFVNECKEIYLNKRAEFRRTGIKRQLKSKTQEQKDKVPDGSKTKIH